MSERNESRFGTNFHVSIEARVGVTTGISAADRARTIQAAVDPEAGPHSVVSPGHVFPVCARDGGVLVRSGQTEGSVDLARLAGFAPAGVICEIMKDDGTMARRGDLERFAEQHGLGIVTIAQLIQYRLQRETLIEEKVSTSCRPAGTSAVFELKVYQSPSSRTQYMALVLGRIDPMEPVMVRMHRATVPTDVFGLGLDAGMGKNTRALQLIERAGVGVFIYVIPERLNLAHQVQDLVERLSGRDVTKRTFELREFGLGAQILAKLGVAKIRLMTDNVKRIVGLEGYGLEVVERVPLSARSEDAKNG
jgi:3,4-dihydroxy 2-butanone 4-phosphate synthase/GTP cyclohydrolase II